MNSAKRKRSSSTVDTKLSALDDVDRGMKKVDVAIKYGVPKTTLSTWIKNADQIRQLSSSTSHDRKRARQCTYPDVEQALMMWFKQARALNIPLSGPVLVAKASQLAAELGHSDFKCSDGWLTRFKSRHDITFRTISGEAAAVDTDVVHQWQQDVLGPLLRRYSADDVYNADETGLFYQMLPSKSMMIKGDQCSGGKHSKVRITLLVCANMTGRDKLPLFAIGKSQKPRCFKGVRTLPCKYAANKRAWMTGELFEEWVHALDRKVKLQGRKVALVLDNAPSHPHNIRTTNVELVFLPPNTTAVSQPMDQGVIKNLKDRYRRQVLHRYLAAVESKKKPSITVADALFMARTAWDSVSSTTIQNCFRHCHFVAPDSSELFPVPEEEEENLIPLAELLCRAETQGLDVCSVEDCRDADQDCMTCQALSDSDIAVCVQQSSSPPSSASTDSDSEDETVCDNPPSFVSAAEAMDCLRSFVQSCPEADGMLKHVAALQNFVNANGFQKKRQESITSFFKKA